jgi:methyl coenzyme M reductase subunit C-like uncharacterized protein (methanogenesis marker protein 7)
MDNENKPIENEYLDENGRFKEGNPGGGRKPETPEIKFIRKAAKEIIADYKQALAEALPMIQPVLIAKAIDGDIQAIKEVHDRAMDKAKQATDITTDGKQLPTPILNVQFNNSDKENTQPTEEN